MNGVKVTYQDNTFIVKDNINEFSDGPTNFLTNKDVLCDDHIEEDETILKRFLFDIRCDIGKGDKRRRYRTIKRILGLKDEVSGRGLNSIDINQNSLIERLEQLILETKA